MRPLRVSASERYGPWCERGMLDYGENPFCLCPPESAQSFCRDLAPRRSTLSWLLLMRSERDVALNVAVVVRSTADGAAGCWLRPTESTFEGSHLIKMRLDDGNGLRGEVS